MLGYNIYKKKEEDWMLYMWFLWPSNKWVVNKDHCKTFYTLDDAISNLSIMKYRDGKAD
jgi:hypothetical protein